MTSCVPRLTMLLSLPKDISDCAVGVLVVGIDFAMAAEDVSNC